MSHLHAANLQVCGVVLGNFRAKNNYPHRENTKRNMSAENIRSLYFLILRVRPGTIGYPKRTFHLNQPLIFGKVNSLLPAFQGG